MKTFNDSKITFKYPLNWDLEKADTFNNPDCVATLSKGEENLVNLVIFPTQTNLEEFKVQMEDMITDDGGVILISDFVKIANKNAIYVKANIDTPEINYDIHTYVFIEKGEIFIFELRTIENSNTSVDEYKSFVDTFEVK